MSCLSSVLYGGVEMSYRSRTYAHSLLLAARIFAAEEPKVVVGCWMAMCVRLLTGWRGGVVTRPGARPWVANTNHLLLDANYSTGSRTS